MCAPELDAIPRILETDDRFVRMVALADDVEILSAWARDKAAIRHLLFCCVDLQRRS